MEKSKTESYRNQMKSSRNFLFIKLFQKLNLFFVINVLIRTEADNLAIDLIIHSSF